MQKILFIVDEGWPIESAPGVRIHSFIKELQDQQVLLLQGARGHKEQEKNIFSLQRPPEKKILQFILFLVKLNYKAIILSKKYNPDSIILSIPKYELLFCVPFLKTKKLVLDIRDSYDFIDYKAYFNHFFPIPLAKMIDKIIKRGIKYLLEKAIKKASIITVANKAIKETVHTKKGIIIENGVDTDLFKPSKTRTSKYLNLVYLGNFAEKDDFTYLYEALPISGIKLHLIGEGRNKEKVLQEFNKRKIIYEEYGKKTHQEVAEILKSMDIGYICREKSVQESIPVCIYEFMAMNIPTIVNDVGLTKEFVEQERVGFIIKSAKECKEILQKCTKERDILQQFSHLHKKAQKKFSRKIQAQKLRKILLLN